MGEAERREEKLENEGKERNMKKVGDTQRHTETHRDTAAVTTS